MKFESSQSWDKPNIRHRSFFQSCCRLWHRGSRIKAPLSSSFAQEYPCMAQLGEELCACPDWTPLEPRFRSRGRNLKELVSLPEAWNMDDLLLSWLIQRRTRTHTHKHCLGLSISSLSLSLCILYIYIYLYLSLSLSGSAIMMQSPNCKAHTSHHFPIWISKTMSISSFIKRIIFGYLRF